MATPVEPIIVAPSHLLEFMPENPEAQLILMELFPQGMPVTYEALQRAKENGVSILQLGRALVWQMNPGGLGAFEGSLRRAYSIYGEAAELAVERFRKDGQLQAKDEALTDALNVLYSTIIQIVVEILNPAEAGNTS